MCSDSIEHRATNDLAMDKLTRPACAEWAWSIENCHRGLKPCCGVKRSQVRSLRAERKHVGMAIRAFLRLERQFYTTGVSWYEAKAQIVRRAVQRTSPGLCTDCHDRVTPMSIRGASRCFPTQLDGGGVSPSILDIWIVARVAGVGFEQFPTPATPARESQLAAGQPTLARARATNSADPARKAAISKCLDRPFWRLFTAADRPIESPCRARIIP